MRELLNLEVNLVSGAGVAPDSEVSGRFPTGTVIDPNQIKVNCCHCPCHGNSKWISISVGPITSTRPTGTRPTGTIYDLLE